MIVMSYHRVIFVFSEDNDYQSFDGPDLYLANASDAGCCLWPLSLVATFAADTRADRMD